MKKWCTTVACALACTATLFAQDDKDVYQYYVNLNDVSNDMLNVELIAPSSVSDPEIIFHFPATVPGTYEILNFGQFVQDLKAFDKKNRELKVERTDQNTWKILAERRVYKITYKIEDTWDATVKTPVFEPAGTNFQAGKNFVLNQNGCFGFFKDKESLPYEITFDRSSTFHGATSLERIGGDFDTDIYRAENYRELVDAPLMYAVPDTVNFKLGYSNIEIAVYSPNKKVTAKELSKRIRPVIEAQNKYLGDILPVDRYVFILYLSPDGYTSGSIGALEHSRSSMFCLAEEAVDKIGKQVCDIAAHEFFHIVTPLFIHSEEIHNFNFMTPKMSQHLWLYEGSVEYMAQHVQVKYGLMKQSEFLDVLGEKVRTSMRYKEGISLTEMSSNCLVDPYAKQYNNIYYKGAMVGACLELKLLALSKGQYGLQDLIKDLSGFYGKETPFKDSELFEKVYEMATASTFITKTDELKQFFDKYVKGTTRIPYNEFFNPVGIEYAETARVREISPLGGIENGVLKTDSLSRFFIAKYDKLDEFGQKSIGFQQDDIIVEWNGRPFTVKTVSGILLTYLDNAKEGDPLEVKILRKNASGAYEQKVLKTVTTPIEVEKKHVFRFMENATPEQLQLRKVWLESKA